MCAGALYTCTVSFKMLMVYVKAMWDKFRFLFSVHRQGVFQDADGVCESHVGKI